MYYELCGEYNVPIQFMRESGLREFVCYIKGRMRAVFFDHSYLAGIELSSIEYHGNLHGAGTKRQQKEAKRSADERLKHPFFKLFKNG